MKQARIVGNYWALSELLPNGNYRRRLIASLTCKDRSRLPKQGSTKPELDRSCPVQTSSVQFFVLLDSHYLLINRFDQLGLALVYFSLSSAVNEHHSSQTISHLKRINIFVLHYLEMPRIEPGGTGCEAPTFPLSYVGIQGSQTPATKKEKNFK